MVKGAILLYRAGIANRTSGYGSGTRQVYPSCIQAVMSSILNLNHEKSEFCFVRKKKLNCSRIHKIIYIYIVRNNTNLKIYNRLMLLVIDVSV